MKTLACEQGSAEWQILRLGRITCSGLERILTSKTRKLASGRTSYMHELLASWLIGEPTGGNLGGYVERGTEMEPAARADYEFAAGAPVQRVGFILADDESFGGSPDGLVGADGGVDFKCPAAPTHIGYILSPDSLRDDYYAQVQGYMLLTGRAWWDLRSYNPVLPSVTVRVPRDAEYLALLSPALAQFRGELHAARAKLRALGCISAAEADEAEAEPVEF